MSTPLQPKNPRSGGPFATSRFLCVYVAMTLAAVVVQASDPSRDFAPDEDDISMIQHPGDPFLNSIQRARPDLSSGTTSPFPTAKPTLSSYSFDSREWVEYYPHENEISPDFFSSDHYSSFPARSGRETVPPLFETMSLAQTDPWEMTSEEKFRIASAQPLSVAVERPKKITPSPGIDLSPSYSKRLPHTETCGVVVVQANFPLTEIRSILTEIAQLQRDLNLYMGIPAPKEKIELCLFKDEKSYIQFLQAHFPKAPKDRRALYIKLNDEPGTLLVQRSQDFDIDLRHEMTHAIIHASIRTVPIWLDEGLAKYFEPPSKDRSERNPYLKAIRWNVKFGAVPVLKRLEKLEHIGEMGSREYRDSWAWVHFMIHHSPDTHRLLAGYLQLLASLSAEEAEGKNIKIPSLGLYLDEVVERPREKYREHFQTWGKVEE